MTYRLRLTSAARRALSDTLPEQVAAAVWEFVSGPLLADPWRVGKPLRWELDGLHAARRGQYRVIYRIVEEQIIVEVVSISHRRDAYA